MSYIRNTSPSILERLVAAASYIMPLIGLAFFIIAYLMKKDLRPFLKYHIFQSIFIAFALWLIISGLGYAMNLLSYIPILKNILGMITFLLNTPLLLGFSIVTLTYTLFILYLVISAIFGKDSYVPWVSDIIKENLRGQF